MNKDSQSNQQFKQDRSGANAHDSGMMLRGEKNLIDSQLMREQDVLFLSMRVDSNSCQMRGVVALDQLIKLKFHPLR
jgi:hypothetical protein